MAREAGGDIADARFGLLIVVCLAALAGVVDACGFYLLKDLYVSFMSGNSTSMASALAHGNLPRVRLIAGIIATFVAGATAGTVLAVLSGRHHVPAVILATAVVLVVPATATGWSVLAMTFAMGMLNAAIHRTGSVDVSVTYVTGTLAKLGRGIGLLLCGQARDWSWLLQGVPWLGLVAGAALASFALVRLGPMVMAALPALAAVMAALSWIVVSRDQTI